MHKRFVYFYLMKSARERILQVVPLHVTYWKKAQLTDYRGGPFADRTGGLILFTTADLGTAKKITDNDPFVLENLIEASWVKEWFPE
jgi:hypothetical protein